MEPVLQPPGSLILVLSITKPSRGPGNGLVWAVSNSYVFLNYCSVVLCQGPYRDEALIPQEMME